MFTFTTTQKDAVVLMASCLGYNHYTLKTTIELLVNFEIILEPANIQIDEVVVVASSFNFGQELGKVGYNGLS